MSTPSAPLSAPPSAPSSALCRCLTSCLLLVLYLTPATAEEDAEHWQPHAHPASSQRQLTAFTRPVHSLHIAAEDAGRLETLLVDSGEVIQSEDADSESPHDWVVVAELDSSLARNQVDASQAALAQAKAQHRLASAEAALAAREEEWLQGEWQRIDALAQQQRAATRDADELRYRYDAARLNQQRAQAALEVAAAGVSSAEASLQRHRLIAQRHQLRAPLGWQVSERLAEPGSHLSPGTPVLELVDCRQLELTFVLSEAELAALRRQDEVQLELVSQGSTLRARLHHVDPRFDPASRKRQVRLRLAGEQLEHPSGGLEMRLRLDLPDPGALYIPAAFAYERLGQWLVRDVDGKEHAINPLRQVSDGGVVVAATALPTDITLQRPASNERQR